MILEMAYRGLIVSLALKNRKNTSDDNENALRCGIIVLSL